MNFHKGMKIMRDWGKLDKATIFSEVLSLTKAFLDQSSEFKVYTTTQLALMLCPDKGAPQDLIFGALKQYARSALSAYVSKGSKKDINKRYSEGIMTIRPWVWRKPGTSLESFKTL